MKRLIILLLLILVFSFVAGAADETTSGLDVKLSVKPESYGFVEIRNSDGDTYSTYSNNSPVCIDTADGYYRTGKAYLYYYAVGPTTLKLQVVIEQALKSDTKSVNYKITFSDTASGKWNGESLKEKEINSSNKRTISISTMSPSDEKNTLEKEGMCLLTFTTTDMLTGFNFNDTFESYVTVKLISD